MSFPFEPQARRDVTERRGWDSNPLGFLAALGVLNVVSDAAADRSGGVAGDRKAGSEPGRRRPSQDLAASPRLSWRDDDAWRPLLYSAAEDVPSLVKTIREDLCTWKGDPSLQLRYEKRGAATWDLKPPPEVFRKFLGKVMESKSPRALEFVSAFAAEGALDNNGNIKPTALHFTAGQQEFLQMIDLLVRNVSDKDIENALVGPWKYDRGLRAVLNWDATASRDYALRAKDPAKEKLGNPGADWLAFRGLSFLRVFASRRSLLTTGCWGEWKTGVFRWALWLHPIERETVRTLLTLRTFAPAERSLRGIPVVYDCAIRRSDQGGYGSFAPPAIV